MRTEQGILVAPVLALLVACGAAGDPAVRASEDAGPGGPQANEPNRAADAGEPAGVDGGGVPSAGGGNGSGAGGNGAGGGSAGGGADGGATVEPPSGALPLELDGAPEHFRHVRLTHQQWENSVRDNLRWSMPTGLLDTLQPDAPAFAYSNNEERLEVRPELAIGYADAAEALARQVAADSSLLAAVYAGNDASGFIEEVGRRFHRRPLSTEETERLEQVFEVGSGLPSASDEFSGGAGLVLEVLLQSPHFLYRIESADPGARLNGYELATKLAYFITNTTPSDALLDRAAAGELDSDEGLRDAAEELLAEPAAVQAFRGFHAETFRFERYAGISKVAELGYDEAINADLEEAAGRFFDRILTGGFGLREVFASDRAHASDAMAALYGVEGPGGPGLIEVRLGPERPGFFAQLPFLLVNSVNEQPNPITRGGDLNYRVLCAPVPPDPGTTPGATTLTGDETNRERITAVTSGRACEGCHHGYLNPLGFAFENFDGFGRTRELDNGRPVDTSASYPFVEGRLEFSGAVELMQVLAESQQAHRCHAAHLSEFGLAHELGTEEAELVDGLTRASLEDNASLAALVVELVASPAFHTKQGSP